MDSQCRGRPSWWYWWTSQPYIYGPTISPPQLKSGQLNTFRKAQSNLTGIWNQKTNLILSNLAIGWFQFFAMLEMNVINQNWRILQICCRKILIPKKKMFTVPPDKWVLVVRDWERFLTLQADERRAWAGSGETGWRDPREQGRWRWLLVWGLVWWWRTDHPCPPPHRHQCGAVSVSHGIHRVQLSGKGRKFQGSKIYDRKWDLILIPAVLHHCISFQFMNFYSREYELCFFLSVNSVMLSIYRTVPPATIGHPRARIAGSVSRVAVMAMLTRAIPRQANVWSVLYVMLSLSLIIRKLNLDIKWWIYNILTKHLKRSAIEDLFYQMNFFL